MSLVTELKEKLAPYYKSNNSAHQIDHAEAVADLAIRMAKKYLWGRIGMKEIITACYLHDIAEGINHDNHHTIAVSMLEKGVLSEWLNLLCYRYNMPKIRIIRAVLEHRASFEGEYSFIISEVVSAADRGKPDVEAWVRRLIKSWIANYPQLNVVDIITKTFGFMKKKYGRNGYTKYPDIYREFFKEELEQAWSVIDNNNCLMCLVVRLVQENKRNRFYKTK